MSSLTDWRFVVGASILGYLLLSQADAFNKIITSGGKFAGDYTKILQGR